MRVFPFRSGPQQGHTLDTSAKAGVHGTGQRKTLEWVAFRFHPTLDTLDVGRADLLRNSPVAVAGDAPNPSR